MIHCIQQRVTRKANFTKSPLNLAPRLNMTLDPHLLRSACAAYQLSIDICCGRPRSAANQPHAAAGAD